MEVLNKGRKRALLDDLTEERERSELVEQGLNARPPRARFSPVVRVLGFIGAPGPGTVHSCHPLELCRLMSSWPPAYPLRGIGRGPMTSRPPLRIAGALARLRDHQVAK